ncbi:hypothetical protein BB561_005988 [Smittium simulii]|uniref:GOLD domain-containing protein n=1 Tax=Smittium simulii TaxID=133385 RepID=A0A2T9Y771_9FUNG|nr:hypothetical protein BB561_005988 [Smittium simulii]
MKAFLFIISLLAATSNAITLSSWIHASDTKCFYAHNDQPGQKMSFYFSVQEGGNFDIDFAIYNPKNEPVVKQEAERHGDLVFTANEIGDYSFCFSNKMSTLVDKLVEFQINVEDEARDPDIASRDSAKNLDFGASRIFGDLYNIERLMLYFRSRENRNFATVQSTETRILWFAVLESACVIFVAILQVYSIQSLFTAKKTRF